MFANDSHHYKWVFNVHCNDNIIVSWCHGQTAYSPQRHRQMNICQTLKSFDMCAQYMTVARQWPQIISHATIVYVVPLPHTCHWYKIQKTLITTRLPRPDKSYCFMILLSAHLVRMRLDSLGNSTSGARGSIWRDHTEGERSCIK